jgi:hypothetical protein
LEKLKKAGGNQKKPPRLLMDMRAFSPRRLFVRLNFDLKKRKLGGREQIRQELDRQQVHERPSRSMGMSR